MGGSGKGKWCLLAAAERLQGRLYKSQVLGDRVENMSRSKGEFCHTHKTKKQNKQKTSRQVELSGLTLGLLNVALK